MTHRWANHAFLVMCCYISETSFALGIRPTAITGLLQQPSSQYFHYIYGASIDLQLINSWVIRGTYLERPAFSNAGFIDQDFLGFAETGCALFSIKQFEVLSFIGAGQAWGYIKEDPAEHPESYRRNGYRMNTLSMSMEAGFKTSFFDTRVGHALHIGQGDKFQTEAKVVWPYSTYYITLSKLFGTDK